MSYRNFSASVQIQIDKILRNHRSFVRIYINDIVIFFKILKKHVMHLKQIFEILNQNSISINSSKIFLKISFINLLNQHVTLLRLLTDKQKLHAIFNLIFSKNLSQFESYFELIQ